MERVMVMEHKRTGRIHSLETFGAVDGPGVRFVVFLQGCPLRCRFCHNPDTWNPTEGTEMTAEELTEQIASYRNFIRNGGVTISGGEPLLQPEFVRALLEQCRAIGLHTAVDTSGGVPLSRAKPVVDAADLLLLDIKDIDPEDCRSLTGQDNRSALTILDYCEQTGKPVWIRHVLIPGLTLREDKLVRLAKKLSAYQCIQKVELLPFHKMGEYKWDQLNRPYTLAETPAPDQEELCRAKEIFRLQGLPL